MTHSCSAYPLGQAPAWKFVDGLQDLTLGSWDQLTISNSEIAPDSLPPLGAGVGRGHTHLCSGSLHHISAVCFCFCFSFGQQKKKKKPSSLPKTSQVSHRGTCSSWAGFLELEERW